jgi:MFS family permease
MGWYSRKITINDDEVTNARHLTNRQSLVPNGLGALIPPPTKPLGLILLARTTNFFVQLLFSSSFGALHTDFWMVYFFPLILQAPFATKRYHGAGGTDDGAVLNSHFQSTLNITASMSAGLSAAYFGAYFLCPPTISGWILRRFGFRVTFMTGLAVLAVGCLLFWPSGVKRSFGGFCGSMFVVGAGLSTLETAADP